MQSLKVNGCTLVTVAKDEYSDEFTLEDEHANDAEDGDDNNDEAM